MTCEYCNDTGWYGDNGPGIRGNAEYQPCDQCAKGRAIEQAERPLETRQADEIAALKADNERLLEAITEWARSFGLAAPMWKELPVNMALFKIAAQLRGGD